MLHHEPFLSEASCVGAGESKDSTPVCAQERALFSIR